MKIWCLNEKYYLKWWERKINIEDNIVNAGYNDTPYMLIYHINFGFPIITEKTRFLSPALSSRAFNDDAYKGSMEPNIFQSPTHHYAYECFVHDMPEQDDNVYAALINKKLNFGGYLKYSSKELPNFITWKMMGEQDYVVAMEPGTNLPEGRVSARKNNRLITLRAREEHKVHLEIGILEGEDQIKKITELMQ